MTALLCLAAAAPQRPQMAAPPCETYSHSGGGDSLIQMGFGGAVRQPLPAGVSIAACTLGVHGVGFSNAYITFREWDPLTLAPDPQTVMLRAFYFSTYNLTYGGSASWMQFFPPLISRSLHGVAEPPRPTTVVEVRNAPFSMGALETRYAPEGNPAMHAALTVPGGPTGEFQGSHPVLAHALCSGDEDTQLLAVAQSVRSTDTPLSDRPAELVQAFNVPEEVELRWVELAVDSAKLETLVTPETIIAIVDGAPVPDIFMPPSLVEAPFPYAGTFPPYTDSGLPADPRWAANLDFDHTVTLYPGQDYWLYVRAAHAFTFAGRALTGSEPPEFTAGIGTLFTRNSTVTSWHPVAGRVLSFKLVGRPASTTSVPGTRAAFALGVTPNPARGIAEVAWSGAVGPVRLEVLDAHGRRVAAGSGGAAGTWSWGVVGARPLAAGVYFVQARDSEDRRVIRRFVLVK